MSNNNDNDDNESNLPPISAEPIIDNPILYTRIVLPRKSYNKENTLRYKEVIDAAVRNQKQAFIDRAVAGNISVSTLQHRLNEALRWLIDNNDKEFPSNSIKCHEYNTFRQKIRFSPVNYGGREGVMIEWGNTKGAVKKKKPEAIKASDVQFSSVSHDLSQANTEQKHQLRTWRDEVLAFIQDENQQVLSLDRPEDFNGGFLTELDNEWLIRTFMSAGIEYDLGPQLIRGVK